MRLYGQASTSSFQSMKPDQSTVSRKSGNVTKPTPGFTLYSKPHSQKNTTGSISEQLVTLLNDPSELRSKPETCKKGDRILRAKLEHLYEWLFDRLSGGTEKFNYNSLKFEDVSLDVMKHIMPLLVDMRDSAEDDKEDTGGDFVDKAQFLKSLFDPLIVPVYNRVAFQKAIEALKDEVAVE